MTLKRGLALLATVGLLVAAGLVWKESSTVSSERRRSGPYQARGAVPAGWLLAPEDYVPDLCRFLIESSSPNPAAEAAEALRRVTARMRERSVVVPELVAALVADDARDEPTLHAISTPYVSTLLRYHDPLPEAQRPATIVYKRSVSSRPHELLVATLGSWPERLADVAEVPGRRNSLPRRELAAAVRKYALDGGPEAIRALALLLRSWGNDATRAFERQVFAEEILNALPYGQAAALFEQIMQESMPDDSPTVLPPLANQLGVAMGRFILEPSDFLLAANRAERSHSSVVRMMFIVALGSTETPSPIAERALGRLAIEDSSTPARHAAVVNLARIAPPDTALPVIRSFLQIPSTDAQAYDAMTALVALNNLSITSPESTPSVRDVVREVLGWPASFSANGVKIFALSTADRERTRSLRDEIETLTEDPDPRVRAAATKQLKNIER